MQPHIHVTISPSNTLTPAFHFHTCPSGSRNAPPVNSGSEGPDCVGDVFCALVEDPLPVDEAFTLEALVEEAGASVVDEAGNEVLDDVTAELSDGE